ncbi:LOW QUALITY PROTEIN: phospholipase A1 [Musca domestica]|uniref:LOW QUALITY PROTEIN: phospholipase A1 n=1 Tax=Musca domestica TaxID=7370 RepID=A0A9J7IFI0_MUSDO|nr:LOW QUALITY PROTEIN: phospholipase A1 [Musca domestica]
MHAFPEVWSRSIKIAFIFIVLNIILTNVYVPVACAPPESREVNGTTDDVCVHTLKAPSGFFKRHFDKSFLKKFFKHWIPFVSNDRVKMQFFLYKRDFPECGREIVTDDVDSVTRSGFNADHPTRIIIHGWMSQSKGSFNRAVKNAYMSLARPTIYYNISSEMTISPLSHLEAYNVTGPILDSNDGNDTDFNVIVVDWSVISSNVNYFGVVDLIEDLGFLLAEFMRFLHLKENLYFGDVYLIGHSLGAQIAGSAGKQIHPFRINTIFALDPAGPKFRDINDNKRLDPSDADYVESIQTSSSLGFEDPVGHATFYPNFGKDQKKCYIYGCSHSRAYNYFAESITSEKGFWGTLCQRQSDKEWILSTSGVEFKMGGEPSTPKRGTFYVKTNGEPPYALGRRKPKETNENLETNNDVL